MKALIVWILGPLIACGMAAVAGTSYNDRAELQAAHHSRDFAAREVCKGQPFEWENNILICHRERP